MFLEIFPLFLLLMVVITVFLFVAFDLLSQIDESDRRLLEQEELEKEGTNND